MKYSLQWMGRHIDGVFPPSDVLAREITEKAFEVEEIQDYGTDTILEVKVLPDRAHDALSHRGMAREIAALFGIKRKELTFGWPNIGHEITPIQVSILDPDWCFRYIGITVEGVFPKESPKWLRDRLEAIGQRSINALVDITNFVMFDIGQPMHVFDANKLTGGITVRLAKRGETMRTLDNKLLELDGTELVIADDEAILALAGVKGGKKAEVDTSTTSIVLESANFHSTRTRQTSAKHGIRTDASKRYENGITSRFAEDGAKQALALILELYPDARVGQPMDIYPKPEREYKTGVSAEEVRKILGCTVGEKDVSAVLDRAHIHFEKIVPRERVVDLARSVVGKPFRRGASVTYDAPDAFDCSSLVAWLYKEAGYSIPRISVDQFAFARPIPQKELLPGDLVFANTGTIRTENGIHFATREWMPGTPVPEGIDHVGIFVGNGEVIHATSAHGKVVREKLADSAQFASTKKFGRIIEGDDQRYVVVVPPERLDLRRTHDVVEEIGRFYGYNRIPAVLPQIGKSGSAHRRLYFGNKVRKYLVERGYSEVYTYSFARKGEGDIEVINPVGKDRPFIRRDLTTGIRAALVLNMYNGPLIGAEDVRIFEFGNVFKWEKGEIKEQYALVIANAPGNKRRKNQFEEELREIVAEIPRVLGCEEKLSAVSGSVNVFPADSATLKYGGYSKEMNFDVLVEDAPVSMGYEPLAEEKDIRYRSVSPYPFVVRDISLFVPESVTESEVADVLRKDAGELAVRLSCFDRFQREGERRVSYAFRFVFQSFERTLTDDEVNAVMERVYAAARAKGWETR
jgi:phenylalanyl-tRNA synthetase beta subunit